MKNTVLRIIVRVMLAVLVMSAVDAILSRFWPGADSKPADDDKLGKYVYYGAYPQSESGLYSTEIEWIVLDSHGSKVLLLSRYALDCQPYNDEFADVTWETCSLRGWLNDSFFNKAFSAEEQKAIIPTTVYTYNNPRSGTDPGADTTDRVFLLSISEAEQYFTDKKARSCVPTRYAAAGGGYGATSVMEDGTDTCWWWLRSPGSNSAFAANVLRSGTINYGGGYERNYNLCVRPAMWIDLDIVNSFY